MCGWVFQVEARPSVDERKFSEALNRISWRGPDAHSISFLKEGSVAMGHNRLAIIDPVDRSNQPMISDDEKYAIIFNGEIYNHKAIKKSLNLNCYTSSDTEVILQGYAKIGTRLFEKLDGMFAFVILDTQSGEWVCARDGLGIKPLYFYLNGKHAVISSECSAISELVHTRICEDAITEWKVIRRPLPGKTFFTNIQELEPGTYLTNSGSKRRFWSIKPSSEAFNQEEFEEKIKNSVRSHEMSDVGVVGLLSGGLDSAIISSQSVSRRFYTVGLHNNNEFEGASETADCLGLDLERVAISEEQLIENWKFLTRLKREPISLPNEGLIFSVCRAMKEEEKVVLTGEGADEILFGYDGIYRWALEDDNAFDAHKFLNRYGYCEDVFTERLIDFVNGLSVGKSLIQFLEDFFLSVHLPGLLRRMDFSSMAASKEARVPFVSKDLIEYLYRRDPATKINEQISKIPLRKFAEKSGLVGVLERKKIGFSAQSNQLQNRKESYEHFRSVVLGELQWS